jgi:hypothetical protein
MAATEDIVVSDGSEEEQELITFVDGINTLSGEWRWTHVDIKTLVRSYNADAWFSGRVLWMKHIVAKFIRSNLRIYFGCISNLRGKTLANVMHNTLSNDLVAIREAENRTVIKLEPSTLVNDKVVMRVSELGISDQGINNSCASGDRCDEVEPFCAPYLRSPVALFLAIMIFIIGQRLNSYGLDGAGVVVAVFGWLSMAVSAAILVVFIAPFFAHWIT